MIIDGDVFEIFFGEVYHLQEIEPPDGYGTISFDYLFTLVSDMNLVDYNHFVYYYSDSMRIKNWPLEGLVIEKDVESTEEEDLKANYHFKISILDDSGEVDTSYNEKNGDDQFVNGVFEFILKNREQKMFWGFERGIRYKVEEILEDEEGNEFTTTVGYYTFDEDGNVEEHITETGRSHTGELTQETETIVFTNKKESKGSVNVKKTVREGDTEDPDNEEKFWFGLSSSGDSFQRAAGTANFEITAKDGEKTAWTDLPFGTYYVFEMKLADSDEPVSGYIGEYTVTGSGTEVELSASSLTATAEITNTKELTDFGFTKEWKDLSGEALDWPKDGDEDIPITLTLKRKTVTGEGSGRTETVDEDFEYVYSVTSTGGTCDTAGAPAAALKAGTEYEFIIEGLPKNKDGAEYIYYMAESLGDQLKAYRVSYGSQDMTSVENGGTITNTDASVTLPNTGGSGTGTLRLLGIMLLAFAAAMYGNTLYKRRTLLKKDDSGK